MLYKYRSKFAVAVASPYGIVNETRTFRNVSARSALHLCYLGTMLRRFNMHWEVSKNIIRFVSTREPDANNYKQMAPEVRPAIIDQCAAYLHLFRYGRRRRPSKYDVKMKRTQRLGRSATTSREVDRCIVHQHQLVQFLLLLNKAGSNSAVVIKKLMGYH